MYPLPTEPSMSIIVPTLNEEKLIAGTLKNAREVAPGAEIIVVDGGSMDDTAKIAKKYAKVIVKTGNVASARNAGAEEASGDVLIFLDADTKITRQFIEGVVKNFKRPEIVGAGGLIMPQRKGLLQEIVFYFFNFLVMVSFVWEPFLAGTCVAYKRKPFFDVNGFDVKRNASEDVEPVDIEERLPLVGDAGPREEWLPNE
jgi:glycosyltransferase involved in cell wall biosynthesis